MAKQCVLTLLIIAATPLAYADPAADTLAALAPADRANAQLELELLTTATPTQVVTADKIAATWNTGDHDAALAALAQLEATGVAVAVGVSWREPVPAGATAVWGGDQQIGAADGFDQTELDFNVDNGDLFALLVDFGVGWRLNRSTDGGTSWSQTYLWTGPVAEADLALTRNYAYVGYVSTAAPDEARLRRSTLPTGSSDNAYGFQVVHDASPSTVKDISLESNAELIGNRIYYAMIRADGDLLWFWDDDSDGFSFNGGGTGVTDADRGLDMHWNDSYTDYSLFMSFLDASDKLRLSRLDLSWSTVTLASGIPVTTDRTAVAARDDTVIVVFEDDYPNGTGIAYRVSYDAGDLISFGTIDAPTPSEGNMSSPDVTSRSGTGFAVAYNVETGEPDEVRLAYRSGYSFGSWHTRVINTTDVSTGSWTSVIGTPDTAWGTDAYQHGAIYLPGSRAALFTRPATLCADANCDGVVDTYDIDAFVQALLSEADWTAYQLGSGFPVCDFLEANDVDGDGTVDTYDIDAFVVALSDGGCP